MRAKKLEMSMSDQHTVVDMIHAATGMLECTTDRQRKNGTLAFYDADLFEYYMIYETGYARRKNVWGGLYQLNDKAETERIYTWQGKRRAITMQARILETCPFKLAALVIRGYHARWALNVQVPRYKRQYVHDYAAKQRSCAMIRPDAGLADRMRNTPT